VRNKNTFFACILDKHDQCLRGKIDKLHNTWRIILSIVARDNSFPGRQVEYAVYRQVHGRDLPLKDMSAM